MVGIGWTEAVVIIAVAAIFFFGKDKVLDWAKSIGEAKRAYTEGTEGKSKTKKK
jgi:Sec-independent protein translocase protein TatA